ncbi:MAG TPA: hypothetical protein PLU30_04440 [Verrucomicrobiae bacterium]|nr:hypothetical protein [Verrucomicrobiae bacterium]
MSARFSFRGVARAMFVLGLSASCHGAESFRAAKPVWPEGREAEMNVTACFRAVIEAPPTDQPVTLCVAGSSIYRVTVNGEFLWHGPARGPHGYYRVDQIGDLGKRLRPGKNVIGIEVAGYNCNSYYLLDQPSFLQAEITSGDRVLAATGASPDFGCAVPGHRLQKVQRYSFQRPFTEMYRLTEAWDAWRRDGGAVIEPTGVSVQAEKRLTARGVPAPDFRVTDPVATLSRGRLEAGPPPPKIWKDRSLVKVGPQLKGFPEAELVAVPTTEYQSFKRVEMGPLRSSSEGRHLDKGEFLTMDLGINLTGFIGAEVACKEPSRLWLTFDEILRDGDVDPLRLGCANFVEYRLEPGRYSLETIEPYTLRYLKVIAVDGAVEVGRTFLREYSHPPTTARFEASDPRLNKLFAAAVQTFRQNAVDIFMDCPSRERAGWLCDSFFTARAEHSLTGASPVERNFIENFLLPEKFAHLPDGMLPMCYPSDHYNGNFIPNWALWFVVELEEFAARGGDPEIVEGLRGKVLKLFDYFKRYENADGLLEKLEAWVFVEWSEANKFVQDVNYPSNMLYAGALGAAGRIYGMPELLAKAERIRAKVREQSFDGEFFVDNARRKDGRLQVTRNRTEVCQYFAFFFGIADAGSQPELWRKLREDFGPRRKERGLHPDVFPANAFIGNVLRLELLSRAGLVRQILDESVDYHLGMAERTGTLWEHVDERASCDHGFASHLGHLLLRDVLGVRSVEPAARRICVRLADCGLASCAGAMPVPGGEVALGWRKEGQTIRYHVKSPPGWQISVGKAPGIELVEE